MTQKRLHPPTPNDIISNLQRLRSSPEIDRSAYSAALSEAYVRAEGQVALFASLEHPGKTASTYLAYAYRTQQLLVDEARRSGFVIPEAEKKDEDDQVRRI